MILKNNWLVLLLEGLVFSILGAICLINPYVTTLGFPSFFAILLGLGGGIQLIRTFLLRKNLKAVFYSIFSSLFSILVAVLIYKHQMQSILLISCLMIAFLCFDGISKMFYSSLYHFTKSWFLVMLSGFLSLALGLILMMSLPVSSFYTIGILLGVSMLVFGISLFIMGVEVKTRRIIEIL